MSEGASKAVPSSISDGASKQHGLLAPYGRLLGRRLHLSAYSAPMKADATMRLLGVQAELILGLDWTED
jgi:hypothetical protein